jgi:hypothetical protein
MNAFVCLRVDAVVLNTRAGIGGRVGCRWYVVLAYAKGKAFKPKQAEIVWKRVLLSAEALPVLYLSCSILNKANIMV